MSLIDNLQLQEIDDSADELSRGQSVVDDDIVLSDQIDEAALEGYWDKVVEDIHKDTDHLTFDK